MPAGRPTTYTTEFAEELCTALVEGVSVRKFCMRPGSPTQSDVYDWLLRHPEFAEMYTVARERQQDMRGDEIVDISDDVSQTESMARVQAARLQVDSRKWVMSKLAPRKYGDKLELTGAGGGPVMFVTGVVRAGDGARDVTPSIEAQPSDDVGE